MQKAICLIMLAAALAAGTPSRAEPEGAWSDNAEKVAIGVVCPVGDGNSYHVFTVKDGEAFVLPYHYIWQHSLSHGFWELRVREGGLIFFGDQKGSDYPAERSLKGKLLTSETSYSLHTLETIHSGLEPESNEFYTAILDRFTGVLTLWRESRRTLQRTQETHSCEKIDAVSTEESFDFWNRKLIERELARWRDTEADFAERRGKQKF